MDINKLYFVDNNALAKLEPKRRKSEFFRNHCRIPSQVLEEAGKPVDIDLLSTLEYKINAGILSKVKIVMKSLDSSDTSLVDLYHNRGYADPFLVASALYANAEESGKLLTVENVVVSDDKAVRRVCKEFGVSSIDTNSFKTILDERCRGSENSKEATDGA